MAGAGSPIAAGTPPARPANPALPLVIVGGVALVLGLAFFVPRMESEEEAEEVATEAPAPAASAPAGDPRNINLDAMTPEEAAIRLFDRVVRASETGDSAQARMFAPMAIAAFQNLGQLDVDGKFDLGLLHLIDGNTEAAVAQSDAILAEVPTHLFGLALGARAAAASGDQARSRQLYGRFLENYDTEMATGRAEYLGRPNLFPGLKLEAEQGSAR